MSAAVSELVTNPWCRCSLCDVQVHSRREGVNHPCGHAAPAVSVCPNWDDVAGSCGCLEAAAEALQAALEDGDRAATEARRMDPVEVLLFRAERARHWWPNIWHWVGFAVMAALLLGAFATIGTGR